MTTDEKLDKILEHQTEQSITLAKMETDLRHHIKRSDQHEEHLKRQDKRLDIITYLLIAGATAGAVEIMPTLIKLLF